MKRMASLALVAALAVGGCASTQRLVSYGGDGQLTFDGKLLINGRDHSLSIHPRDDTLLVQRSIADGAVDGLTDGLTFGLLRGYRPKPLEIDAALQAWVAETGCSVSRVVEVGADAGSFEGRFTCPPGVSLRRIMADQRAALRRGEKPRLP